jgi:GPH family glycoside/pentoside/hexuronide:cation symporter
LNAGEPTQSAIARFRLVAYALPALPLAIILFPAYAILPSFYASHTHISLTTIGIILLVSRLFDAVIDPFIGHLSDNTRTRWGARKPWLLLGTLASVICVYPLYVPPPDAGPIYYSAWFILFYLSFTLIEIPHKAWGTDLVRSYMERSEVSTYLGMSFALGNLAFAVVPFYPSFAGRGYDAVTLRAVAILVMLLLPLAVGCAIWIAPQGRQVARQQTSWRDMIRGVFTNGPFRHFLAIFVLAGFGQGMFYGSVYLFVTSVLHLHAYFPYVLLADALCTFAAVPVWYRLIAKFEKHRAWGIGMIGSALAVSAMYLITPGIGGLMLLLVLAVLRAATGAVIYVAPHALLGDVVDYDILRTRSNRAGNYHALMALVTKANGAAGGGLALVLVGLCGFKAGVPNVPMAIAGFKLAVLVASSVIVAGSGIVAWFFPLNRRRHDIVQRRILERADAMPR